MIQSKLKSRDIQDEVRSNIETKKDVYNNRANWNRYDCKKKKK